MTPDTSTHGAVRQWVDEHEDCTAPAEWMSYIDGTAALAFADAHDAEDAVLRAVTLLILKDAEAALQDNIALRAVLAEAEANFEAVERCGDRAAVNIARAALARIHEVTK